MGMACSTNGVEEECIYDFGWKARRKKALGKCRQKWVDNIEMDFREID
jgi:hypothetical protein